MKKLLMAMLCLCLVNLNFISAQNDIAVNLSKGMEEPKRSAITDVIGYGDEGYFALRQKAKLTRYVTSIEKFSPDFDLEGTVDVDLTAEGEDLGYAFTTLFNDKMYVFGSYFDKKADRETLYAFEVDVKKMQLNPRPVKIATSIGKRGTTWSYSLSENKQFLAIMSLPSLDKKEPQQPQLFLLDSKLEAIKSISVELDVKQGYFSLSRIEVSNSGDIHALATVFDAETKLFSTKIEDKELVMISWLKEEDAKDPLIYKLNFDDKKVSELSFRIDADGNIVGGGFYTDREKGVGYKGVLFFALDPYHQQIVKDGFKPFGTEELSEFLSSKQISKNKEIEQFDLKDLVVREDGSLVMVAEKYYVVVHETRDAQGRVSRTYTYYYLDLLIVDVNSDLQIKWMKALPKRQVTSNDHGYYSSFALLVAPQKIYILFNDNAENANIVDKGEKMKNFNGKKSVVAMVTVDDSGKAKKEVILQNKTAGIILVPKVCEQVDESTLFIYGQLKNLYRIGTIGL